MRKGYEANILIIKSLQVPIIIGIASMAVIYFMLFGHPQVFRCKRSGNYSVKLG